LDARKRAYGVNVESVCRRLGMSRQNYYAQRQRRQREWVDRGLIEQLVRRERQVQPRIGGRKLHRVLEKELKEAGIELGRDRFFEVLRQRKLLLEPRPAARPHTTHSGHYLPVFTNRIKELKVVGSNQVWVSGRRYPSRRPPPPPTYASGHCLLQSDKFSSGLDLQISKGTSSPGSWAIWVFTWRNFVRSIAT
jgi:hypothetical protein